MDKGIEQIQKGMTALLIADVLMMLIVAVAIYTKPSTMLWIMLLMNSAILLVVYIFRQKLNKEVDKEFTIQKCNKV